LQDYWRLLSANSSIMACRTANPTSFLRSVVGSASLLSATAIFWRLAMLDCTVILHRCDTLSRPRCLIGNLDRHASTHHGVIKTDSSLQCMQRRPIMYHVGGMRLPQRVPVASRQQSESRQTQIFFRFLWPEPIRGMIIGKEVHTVKISMPC